MRVFDCCWPIVPTWLCFHCHEIVTLKSFPPCYGEATQSDAVMTAMTHTRRHTSHHNRSDRLRQQAAPFTMVGGLAAAGWMMIEAGRLIDLLSAHSNTGGADGSKRWSKIEFAAASIAMGALLVAAGKHSHAGRIERSRTDQEGHRR